MEDITKPSITRLARRAGVKSVSDDCFDTIRNLIHNRLEELVRAALIANSEHQTRTLMTDDIYEAFSLVGQSVAHSSELGTSTCTK